MDGISLTYPQSTDPESPYSTALDLVWELLAEEKKISWKIREVLKIMKSLEIEDDEPFPEDE